MFSVPDLIGSFYCLQAKKNHIKIIFTCYLLKLYEVADLENGLLPAQNSG